MSVFRQTCLSLAERDALLQLAAQDPDAWSAALWEQSLERGEITGWWQGEQLVAVLVLGEGYLEMEILYLLVAPAWRRQGIGQQLVQKARQLAKARQAERLLLEVRASNEAAQQLYQAAGFEILGVRKNYYAKHTTNASRTAVAEREDAWVMAQNLST